MELKKMRDMSELELNVELKKMKQELFNLRFQNAIGQLTNTSRIKDVRRTIARVLTVLQEKEVSVQRAGVRG